MNESRHESDVVIPDEWRGYCNMFLHKYRDKLAEAKSDKERGMFERLIASYESDSEALLREVKYRFEANPRDFGVEKVVLPEAKPVEPAPVEQKQKEVSRRELPPLGFVEDRMMERLDRRLAPKPGADIAKNIRQGQKVKGRLS